MMTRSTDSGATWSDWKKFSFIGDAPFLFKHSSGRIYCGFREKDGADRYTSLIWTADAGLTWSAIANGRIYTHVTTDCSYPAIVEQDDSQLLVVHYEPRFIRQTPVTLT